MKVQIAGQEEELTGRLACADALKRDLSGKKFRQVLAAEACDPSGCRLLDLSSEIPADCQSLEPVYADSAAGLAILRHSTAHVLAAAATKLFPGIRVAIGPAIENGFYYDFDYERPLTPADLEALEAEMGRITAQALPFEHELVSRERAIELFRAAGEKYKLEILDGIADSEVGLYKCGDFTDL